MRDLSKLNDEDLLRNGKDVVRREREAFNEILDHLYEVDRRRLYCGHESLNQYAVKILGYDEDQASRRISAMRLIREMPNLEAAVKSGEILQTHIKIARSIFANEKKNNRELTPETKQEIFARMSGLSVREAQRAALAFVPDAPPKPDHIHALPNGRNLLNMEMTDQVLAKLQRLKGMVAHVDPNISMNDLIDRIADVALE